MNFFINEPQGAGQACIIWMHGLGADAQDMKGLAQELNLDRPVRHVFIDAPIREVTANNHMPMRAWYDIYSFSFRDKVDRTGIIASEEAIQTVISQQLEAGFSTKQIFLAGFSQGGSMALFTGLRYKEALAGIIGLSTWLPLHEECTVNQPLNLPIFLGYGQQDDLVNPALSEETMEWLRSQRLESLFSRSYSMGHSVCYPELIDLTRWLNERISELPTQAGGEQ
ncbi:alpha/beta hydrolase [Legionella yabuuchiae]|uniref:alpha/beta hydrolase n=1 Tax=Legionella yabuuchiae TaxID=376727 RepID=UPI001055F805|nr:carboxylesterase [Legionella yabuuchiae]